MSKTDKEKEKEKDKEKKKSQPVNITGNRPAPDRSPNSTEEGKRQERAKMEQKMRAEQGGKDEKKKGESMTSDPRRYYQGSEMQNKLEEINNKIASSTDAGEKSKLRKELDDLAEETEEEKEDENLVAPTATTTTTAASKPAATGTASTKTVSKF